MAKQKNSRNTWVLIVTILAFTISLIFSSISELVMPKVNIIIGIIILILFIIIGIIFDMVGVAVTSSDEEPLHSMNAKKIEGAKTAVTFKKNADKVSSFCNDVIGDICGIVSGSAGVTISILLAKKYNLNSYVTGLLITALIAAFTIGGKAFFKKIAINNSNKITYLAARTVSIFKKKK